jgi:NADPH2:quinone reductase
MKAWQIQELGEPRDVLRMVDVAIPEPAAGQLVVRVLAAAANFPDVLMSRGLYQNRPPLPFTPGVELCGVVVTVGVGVKGFATADRVLGLSVLPSGGFAEFAIMDSHMAFHAPAGLDDAEAASLLMAYQTGWFGLHRRASIAPADVLLVHAAAGGVGSAAVQLGKAAGARVIGVVGSAEKVVHASRLGADLVINRSERDFVDVVNAETGGRGADVIYDLIGGDVYHRSTKCIAFEGRLVTVGFAGGEIQTTALNHPLVKNYSIVGLHWGLYVTRDPAGVADCQRALEDLVRTGAIRPLIGKRLALDELPSGLQQLAEGATIGRIVCEVSNSG